VPTVMQMLEDCSGRYYDQLLPGESEWLDDIYDLVADGLELNERQTVKLAKIWKSVAHAN